MLIVVRIAPESSNTFSTQANKIMASEYTTYRMDSVSLDHIKELFTRMGKNFTPSARENFDFISTPGLGDITCYVREIVLVAPPDGSKGRDVLVRINPFVPPVEDGADEVAVSMLDVEAGVEYTRQPIVSGAVSVFTVLPWNEFRVGNFARYGVPEVLAFNDFKNNLHETGFYANEVKEENVTA